MLELLVQALTRVINSKHTYILIQVVGGLFLVLYLVTSGDLRLSLLWALVFSVISFSVAWLIVTLNLSHRFPSLNRYFIFPNYQSNSAELVTGRDWALKQATYLENGLRGLTVLAAPLEDAIICVPLLLVGVSPLSALFAGILFGIAHLGRFTYIECIGKTIYYTLACYFLLPHGLLTVVAGHLLMDIIGLIGIKIAKRHLTYESRSKPD